MPASNRGLFLLLVKVVEDLQVSEKSSTISFMQKLHFGNMILEELRHQHRSVAWFAEEMSCDRSNMYKLLKHSNLDTGFLVRASLLLHKDFFLAAAIVLNVDETSTLH